jgi:hypothetical protein
LSFGKERHHLRKFLPAKNATTLNAGLKTIKTTGGMAALGLVV